MQMWVISKKNGYIKEESLGPAFLRKYEVHGILPPCPELAF